MGEPIGIASGALTLSIFAFQSTVKLYQLVNSFQTNKREIRDLKSELEALESILNSLQQLASENADRFKNLCLPLLRCGQICKDFGEVIVKCTKHQHESRTSFRDWAKLQYLGHDITGFRNMLANYKATIGIAIGEVNLRTSVVSTGAVQDFRITLQNTTKDLQERLDDLNDKLEALGTQRNSMDNEDRAERERMQAEIESTEKCLSVCAQASGSAERVKINVFEDVSAAQDAHQIIVSTFGDLVSAKRTKADVRATQWLGQMSDASLQQLAKSRGIDLDIGSRIVREMENKGKGRMIFEDQYGPGCRLG